MTIQKVKSRNNLLLDIGFVSLDIIVAIPICFVTPSCFSTSEIRNFLRNLRNVGFDFAVMAGQRLLPSVGLQNGSSGLGKQLGAGHPFPACFPSSTFDITPSVSVTNLHACLPKPARLRVDRSEEHTSELQSPYVISYAVFCLK